MEWGNFILFNIKSCMKYKNMLYKNVQKCCIVFTAIIDAAKKLTRPEQHLLLVHHCPHPMLFALRTMTPLICHCEGLATCEYPEVFSESFRNYQFSLHNLKNSY